MRSVIGRLEFLKNYLNAEGENNPRIMLSPARKVPGKSFGCLSLH
jgi:hypothetical protein